MMGPFMSAEELVVTLAPVAVYWVYAGIYDLLLARTTVLAGQVQAALEAGRGDQEHRLQEGRRQRGAPAAGHPGRHLRCRPQGQ
jgi:hypothetical protein